MDQRVQQERSEWEKAKDAQRAQITQQLRQQRVREFLINLREGAKVSDKRKEIEAANRAAVVQ